MWSGSNRARATRLQAMGRKPPQPIRYDRSLSQAGFLAYPVQLTGPSSQLISWSELFPNLGTAARDSEACRGAVEIVRIHFPPAVSQRTLSSSTPATPTIPCRPLYFSAKRSKVNCRSSYGLLEPVDLA